MLAVSIRVMRLLSVGLTQRSAMAAASYVEFVNGGRPLPFAALSGWAQRLKLKTNMSQPSGSHSKTCRYCGQRYHLTNWMKRKSLRNQRDDQGLLLEDTHQAACWKRRQSPNGEVSHAGPKADGKHCTK